MSITIAVTTPVPPSHQDGHGSQHMPAAGTASSAPTATRTSTACAARVRIEHTLAELGAERLWELLHTEDPTCPRSAR